MVKPLAFIFDMDGVIVDSNPLHRESWAIYNHWHGLPFTPEMEARMYGKRNDWIVRDFFGDGLTEEEVFTHGAAKEALYREMLGPVLEQSLVPGVREFLQRHQGMPIGLATNAEPLNARFVLEEAHLLPLFRVVVDGQQVKNPKPDPEIYLKVAGLLGVEPAGCLVFEDSHSGIAAARAAGMRVAGIRTTHREMPGTEFQVDSFLDPALAKW